MPVVDSLSVVVFKSGFVSIKTELGSFLISGVILRVSSYFKLMQLFSIYSAYPFLLWIGLPSSASSDSYEQSLMHMIFSILSILLLDKNTLCSLVHVYKPDTVSIRLRLRFSSVSENSPVRLLTFVIRLFARLRTRKSVRWLMFSIREILLLWRSSTSSFVRL
jgi:hypothetical protein